MPPKGTHHSEAAKAKLRAARSNQIHPSFAKRGLTQPALDRAALHRVEYVEDWALKAVLYLEKYGSHENFKI